MNGRAMIIYLAEVAIGVALAVGIANALIPGDPYAGMTTGIGKLPSGILAVTPARCDTAASCDATLHESACGPKRRSTEVCYSAAARG